MATVKKSTTVSAPVAKKSTVKKINVQEKPVVGFIGLGIMGSAMSANLHQAGFHVFGFDPSPKQQKVMKKEGIDIQANVADVASKANHILLSLPSVPALMQVAKDIAASAKKGTVVAELGTLPIDAKEAARDILAKAGVILLDCPLSGTGAQAKTRDLVVYASGDKKAIQEMRPVFDGFARAMYNIGDFGQGMKMKLVANHLVAIHNVASAEAILLGVQMGLDANQIVEVIGNSAGSSRMFQVRGPAMANRTWSEATMKIDVWNKDMHLISGAIESYAVPAPVFASCIPVYNAANALGHAKDDTAVVYKVLENWSAPLAKKSVAKKKKKSKK
ncbi:MAG: NAD(P)-dependent oxidoreductase [Betaproteobacteria bacterium]|jgi:3-hydroxyisobutyrate dehydrogenase-like beta-hydroxyacid dehydrogenase